MLTVKTIEEVYAIIEDSFQQISLPLEEVDLLHCCGRTLAEDIISAEFVPSFNRSSVDGFALVSSDTFGCSDSIPAILTKSKEVFMGEKVDFEVAKTTCSPIPTGGQVPNGADSVQMIEYSEDYKDGTIGILKSCAPGQNMIFKGDDVSPGQVVLSKGRVLSSHDIGALAALGYSKATVFAKPKVGIISTGNELVEISEVPKEGEIRDVNSSLLAATVKTFGVEPVMYGIFKDEEHILSSALQTALAQCQIVLISGGSSVGTKDATCKVIEEHGDILAHGIALKPGKPTIVGKVLDKPVIGLPGHPVAAFYVTQLVVSYLLEATSLITNTRNEISATLTESIESNHGRTQCVGVTMKTDECTGKLLATPIRTKSGLITTLAGTDGYFVIPRDCEGLNKDTEITVYIY